MGDVARWADVQRATFSSGLTNASGCVIRHVQHLVAKVPVALIVGATEPPLDDLPLPLPGRTVRRGEVDRIRRE